MGLFTFSSRAETDLQTLRWRSLRRFGERRTLRYLEELDVAFTKLAAGHTLGVSQSEMIQQLLRYRVESHNIFFLRTPEGIFISRVLHTHQQAGLQIFPVSDNQ